MLRIATADGRRRDTWSGDERGGALVEYVGCLALIAALVAPLVAMPGGSIESLFASIVSTLDQIIDA